ncbi:succinylglutamate desuccinylase/aspartoacylase family protein [Roseiconus nitratireducens]|uniref:Succinylglutamate desuccinylase/aspartoacylase family protein n=1 Tax=Roseiconus nitratireducens TaxID=2605748 RepID=A0A5M6D3H4_9BACT|nr:succinylglutamate desuccinylase/aspartoacylase family protein [Roseiconus nitratireducens]KAA5539725.1 succinylglutamate desuccinylase/aspartoacylase family protein [Roseiconus nitratireducens]
MEANAQRHEWFGAEVAAGGSVNTELEISESYSSRNVSIPIRVVRGLQDGPTVFVTGALHGDELNGTGAIRSLIADQNWQMLAGTLVMVPVLNVLGFERHSRYLPDRRDLNRCFPGNASGSMSMRMARVIFDAIVTRCDYGIDLHTAAVRRTNYPNVRTDFKNAECMRLAEAFGAGVILDGRGPKGSFRREATNAGCPTIVVEGGEVWKVEPSVVECMTRGVNNILKELNMMEGDLEKPEQQVKIRTTKWIRAERGGFLDMHVSPGSIVASGQPLATNSTLVYEDHSVLRSPFAGIVIGMTTLPAAQPGEPVVHLGRLTNRKSARRVEKHALRDDVQRTAQEHLSTSVQVVEPFVIPEESP